MTDIDLDDLLADITPEPVETVAEPVETVAEPEPLITYDVDEEVGVVTLPTPAAVVSMVVHNQYLYVAMDNGKLYRSEVRFNDKRNEWKEVPLPEDG